MKMNLFISFFALLGFALALAPVLSCGDDNDHGDITIEKCTVEERNELYEIYYNATVDGDYDVAMNAYENYADCIDYLGEDTECDYACLDEYAGCDDADCFADFSGCAADC